jgi:myo-inositol-1-phosphate synthase
MPGLGAVASTFVAGVMLARRGLALPIGSLTQLGRLRLHRASARRPRIQEVLPLAPLDALAFGAWDIFPDSAYEAAQHAGVLRSEHLEAVRDELDAVRPMTAAFCPGFVRRLDGRHVKPTTRKAELVEALRDDIRRFRRNGACDRLVSVWCASTEVATPRTGAHETIESFEAALARDDAAVTNAQLYGWALVQEGVPVANGSPNPMLDFPAAVALSRARGVPIAGKDFKTGQTLLKTALAPALRARLLAVRGWFSMNILGNRDGEVLDDHDAFRAKEATKKGVLDALLPAALHPELYDGLVHQVRIDYYPPRGDAKEGWDSVDLEGWLGYPMQLKIDWLGRDSILAAPIVLDLALLLDLAGRAGLVGPQPWLGTFFKCPMAAAGLSDAPSDGGAVTQHDLFAQSMQLNGTLRWLAGAAPRPDGAEDYE